MKKRGRKFFDRYWALVKLAEIGETAAETLLNLSYNFAKTILDPPKNVFQALNIEMPFKLNFKERSAWYALVSRMKRDGLIEVDKKKVKITQKGEDYIQKNERHYLNYPRGENSEETILVIFDIPEYRKQWREWLRFHLTNSGFALLQKSVWMGNQSLPPQFLKDLKTHKLLPHVHIFGVVSAGTLNS